MPELEFVLINRPCRCPLCRRVPKEDRYHYRYVEYAEGSRQMTMKEQGWLIGHIMEELRQDASA